MAIPMENVAYSQTEYDKLFPRGYVKTPIEMVKLGENQFTKLKVRRREYLLRAMHQTLVDPIVILNEKRDELFSRLYIKSFKEGEKANNFVMSVVVDINNKPISISTSQRRIDQILAKIKMADSIPYLKGRDGGASPTHGTGSVEPPLPGTTPRGAGTARTNVPADTSLSPNSSEKSSTI